MIKKEYLIPFSFAGLGNKEEDFQNAKVVVVPVPYDGTASYGTGSRHGPVAIIEASRNLELYDEETGIDLSGIGIFTLDEVEPDLASPEAMTQRVREVVSEVLDAEKFPVLLGGEHSITVGAVRALAERYEKMSILQLDAHSDLRDSYWGTRYSHASAMRRALEHCPVTQVGIRSTSGEEASCLKENAGRLFRARDIVGRTGWIGSMLDTLSERVYITIDLDALDPSIMPSVGTPEPGGLLWYETLDILRSVCEKRDVVGFDVVELLPGRENTAPDFLAARLVMNLTCYIFARGND